MALQLEINGTTGAAGRYLSWAPSPCRLRQLDGEQDLEVTLRSESSPLGGGLAVFQANAGVPFSESLTLVIPSSGEWVDLAIAGKWGHPSFDDGDCRVLADLPDGTLCLAHVMVRVRKNANELLPRERQRFLDAFRVLNDAGAGPFADFRDMHVDAADGEEHRGPQFLPWHRAYLLDLERELQVIDPAVSLHYWRFDQPAPKVFGSDFMGATTQVAEGDPAELVDFDAGHPLAGWVTDTDAGILRSAFFDTQTESAPGLSVLTNFPLRSQAQTLALGDRYGSFRAMEGSPHGAAHVSFSGYISSIDTAAKDPLFFMLHANVDRLWSLWQWLERRTDPDLPEVYLEQDRDGRRLDDSLWPWNDVQTFPRPGFAPRGQHGLASSPASNAPGPQPTIRSVIDDQGRDTAEARLGYTYDDVPFPFEDEVPT